MPPKPKASRKPCQPLLAIPLIGLAKISRASVAPFNPLRAVPNKAWPHVALPFATSVQGLTYIFLNIESLLSPSISQIKLSIKEAASIYTSEKPRVHKAKAQRGNAEPCIHLSPLAYLSFK